MVNLQRKAISVAYVPRLFLFLQGIFFFTVAASFSGDEKWFTDAHVWYLSNVNAFIAAGAANLLLAFFFMRKPSRLLIVSVLILVGMATLCRGFDVVFGDGGVGVKLRALGWGIQWLAVVVCVTQIIGAEVDRSTRPSWIS